MSRSRRRPKNKIKVGGLGGCGLGCPICDPSSTEKTPKLDPIEELLEEAELSSRLDEMEAACDRAHQEMMDGVNEELDREADNWIYSDHE